jgi:hypothetical protein
MNDKTHEGWRNYETWLVALHINNHQPLYMLMKGMAAGAVHKYGGDKQSADARRDLATEVEGYFKNDDGEFEPRPWAPDVGGLWSDLINAALQRVDWNEIAEDMIDALESSPAIE